MATFHDYCRLAYFMWTHRVWYIWCKEQEQRSHSICMCFNEHSKTWKGQQKCCTDKIAKGWGSFWLYWSYLARLGLLTSQGHRQNFWKGFPSLWRCRSVCSAAYTQCGNPVISQCSCCVIIAWEAIHSNSVVRTITGIWHVWHKFLSAVKSWKVAIHEATVWSIPVSKLHLKN